MKTYVYFMQSGKKGAIKIGVSYDPEKRLTELQTGSERKLRLLILAPFDSMEEAREVEQGLHKAFAKYHIHGEWFKRRVLRYGSMGQLFAGKLNDIQISVRPQGGRWGTSRLRSVVVDA